MDNIKKTLKDKKLYIFLMITLVFFGIFAKMDFATDTYAVIGNAKDSIMANFLQSGRIVTAICWKMICIINIPIDIVYAISFILAIISVTLSLHKLYNIIKEDVKSDIIAIILATVIIINPFSIELFMYIEKGIITLSILACIYALDFFIKYIQGKDKKKNLIFSTFFMLLSIFCYQGVPALFVAIATIYIFKYSDSFIKFAKHLIITLIIYGIPAVINFITVRFVFTGHRVDGSINISGTISKLIDGCKNMVATYQILPKYFYVICLAIIVVIALIIVIKRKSFTEIFKISFIGFMTILMTILPQAMQNTESIWFVSRSTYAFASLAGILELYCLMLIYNKNEKGTESILALCLTGLTLVILIVQFYRFNYIEIDHYNSNYYDEVTAIEIGDLIKKYQDESGKKVNKISIYKDSKPRFTNNRIFATGDINVSAFATDWSDVNSINYYNNLKLEKIANDETKKEEFLKKNWDFFSEEQIIFEDDTVHICVY